MIRERLYRALPRPRLRAGADGRAREPVRRILAAGVYPSPTADYYREARYPAHGVPVIRRDVRLSGCDDVPGDGTFVVICRYAGPDLLDWLDANASQIAGVALFLDDDIPAMVTEPGAGIDYRVYAAGFGLFPLRRLSRHLDAVWVSTPALAPRHAPSRRPAQPPRARQAEWQPQSAGAQMGPVRIAYFAKIDIHHGGESAFVRAVWQRIAALRPEARLEIAASGRHAGPWRELPGVTILPPMEWDDFRAVTAARGADIALVPMLPSLVNDVRAATKRIDVARLGAAGVFSASPAYGEGEMHLPNDVEAWVAAVLRLVDDAALRRRLALDTLRRVAADADAAGGLPIG